jgi:hypothetical protein
MNLQEFEQILTDMSVRSRAFRLVKAEMIKRGHWKNKDRGTNRTKQELKSRQFTALSIQPKNNHQIKDQFDDFSDGL